jgi:maltose alpha-D-glucosyltransferase/alpha-amylase
MDRPADTAVIADIRTDALWFKDAVIYQLHVKSFFDSNKDGIGDFPGLTARLDYIADLGVNTIWLLPFYPSPRKDDGYDIADYRNVHPDYGTLEDFQHFIAEAHARKIRVITELVLNHTSDQHPWFQRARRAPPGSVERDYYVWSDTEKAYAGTRVIFCDTEKSNWTWDDEAKAYYWHRFYFHQPDLNFDNPVVFDEAVSVMRFWLDMGVDGLRLDAVPYLVEREGTNNENLPETHAILKRLRSEVDAHYPDRLLLAEANQWPEDVQQYFGDGDECQMLFHFPLMPRMYMAIAQEDRFPITDIMRQTPDAPPGCQWATFLRNHDELTLEMVTDKERDYLWKTYASDKRARLNLGIRRRLAPLLEHDRRRIELMNSLLLTIMGTPILYYGDEIGMGDNIYLGDRDGVRTPMQWSPDRNGGFSRADPAALVSPLIMDPLYGYQAVNVETQSSNPHSLLNWVRRMLAVRSQSNAFGRGTTRFLRPQNRKVLAYLREVQNETILCVANMSRTAQAVELDLSEFSGRTPLELSGKIAFPKVGQLTYLLTLPPYGFYWFSLTSDAVQPTWSTSSSDNIADYNTFVLRSGGLSEMLAGSARGILEREVLPAWLAHRRWFQHKSTAKMDVAIAHEIALADELSLEILDVRMPDAQARYALPIAIAWEDAPSAPYEAQNALARVRRRARVGLLTDGFVVPAFARALLANLEKETRSADLAFERGPAWAAIPEDAEVEWIGGDQSNSSLMVGRKAVIKLFRNIVEGIHPEAEMVRHLSEVGFTGIAPLLGEVSWLGGSRPATIAVVQRYLENQGNAFHWLCEQLKRLIDEVVIDKDEEPGRFGPAETFVRIAGRRLGQMHVALGLPTENLAFKPEHVNGETRERWRQLLDRGLDNAFAAMERRAVGEVVMGLVGERQAITHAAQSALDEADGEPLTRIHGDFHLGQVLVASDDAIIIDFEGEPARPIGERRAKNSALRDVAGMLRSFDYVAGVARRDSAASSADRSGERTNELIAQFQERACSAFLDGYAEGRNRPLDDKETRILSVFQLEKAAYEIVYEESNRPDWIAIPVEGFARIAERLRGRA